jgi:hypothetical protein
VALTSDEDIPLRFLVDTTFLPYPVTRSTTVHKPVRASEMLGAGLFGFCCDFAENRVAALKLYACSDAFSRDRTFGMARSLLGRESARLEELLDLVCGLRESWWFVPPTLVGVSRGGLQNLSRVDLHLPLMAWEWTTFSGLWPTVSAILTRWGGGPMGPSTGKPHTAPHWRFSPTILSIGVSEDGSEDLSVYFKPEKVLHVQDAILQPGAVQIEPLLGTRSCKDASGMSGRAVFLQLYAALLQAQHMPTAMP